MNLWHDIPAGSADEFNVIIEVPKGSHNKYEIDKETGIIALDRANYSAAAYPCEYGFIPQTLWDDGDAVDVLVLATFPINTGILVKCRPVGLMEMIDTGEQDNKIICVPVKDKRWEHVQTLKDVNPHTLKELKHFFESYKALKDDKSKVTVPGFQDKDGAKAAFEKSVVMYRDKMKSA